MTRLTSRTVGTEASTLPGWLELQASRQGLEVALRHKRLGVWETRTWRDLLAEVSGLASGLSTAGFGPDSTLVVLSHPRPEALLLALAAQWLGGNAALLDPGDAAASQVRFLGELKPAFVFAEGLEQLERVVAADVAPSLLVYADERGLRAYPHAQLRSYTELIDASDPRVPARLARAHAVAFSIYRLSTGGRPEVQHLSHADLQQQGALLMHTERLGPNEEAFAARAFATGGQARYLIAPWLIAGFRLNFPENLATRDNDRRELGPTLVAGTRETYQRVENLVLERLPEPGSWKRRLIDWALKPGATGLRRLLGYWWVIRPLRDVIGFTRTRAPLLVGEPLPEASQRFFAALGVEVRTWPDPASWQAHVQAAKTSSGGWTDFQARHRAIEFGWTKEPV